MNQIDVVASIAGIGTHYEIAVNHNADLVSDSAGPLFDVYRSSGPVGPVILTAGASWLDAMDLAARLVQAELTENL